MGSTRLTLSGTELCTTCRAHDRCEIERHANNTPKCRAAQIYERRTEINGVPVPRIAALADADKDGRVVILPCHVGDIVYDIEDGTPYATRVVSFVMFRDGSVSCKTVSSFPDVESFGTRIFLTLADAEKALQMRK